MENYKDATVVKVVNYFNKATPSELVGILLNCAKIIYLSGPLIELLIQLNIAFAFRAARSLVRALRVFVICVSVMEW